VPATAVCAHGHIHLLAPCPDGCGRLRPTSVVVGQVPGQQANSVIGGTIENCETAVVVEPGAIAKIGDLTSRDCTTGVDVKDSSARIDVDGFDYQHRRPPRRVRRNKKKKR
jgi:hypothetical protein